MSMTMVFKLEKLFREEREQGFQAMRFCPGMDTGRESKRDFDSKTDKMAQEAMCETHEAGTGDSSEYGA